MSVGSLVASGPMLLAIPVAAAAGAVTFLSPCVLPLVPGYLSYITGMSGTSVEGGADGAAEADARLPDESKALAGTGAQAVTATAGLAGGPASAVTTATSTPALRAAVRPSRRRVVAGAALFVLGFSALFAIEGVAVGAVGGIRSTLLDHAEVLSRVLGVLLIGLGLLFAGAFDRFSFSGRIVKPSFRPRAGLASAPLVGVLFGLGWTPCIGPTLSAVLALGFSSGTAARGGLLAFIYGLGLGIPFLTVAFALERGVTLFGFARRHARLITRIGGLLLIAVGLLEVTGAWSSAVLWLKFHWFNAYTAPF